MKQHSFSHCSASAPRCRAAVAAAPASSSKRRPQCCRAPCTLRLLFGGHAATHSARQHRRHRKLQMTHEVLLCTSTHMSCYAPRTSEVWRKKLVGVLGGRLQNQKNSHTDLCGRLQTSNIDIDARSACTTPHCTHIASTTFNTMLFACSHSWSPALRLASEVCQLFDASTSFVLQTKTS